MYRHETTKLFRSISIYYPILYRPILTCTNTSNSASQMLFSTRHPSVREYCSRQLFHLYFIRPPVLPICVSCITRIVWLQTRTCLIYGVIDNYLRKLFVIYFILQHVLRLFIHRIRTYIIRVLKYSILYLTKYQI